MLRPPWIWAGAVLFVAVAVGAPAHEGGAVSAQQLEPARDDVVQAWTPRTVDVINQRFLNGHASTEVGEAGVVIHQFDDSGFDTASRRLREGGVSEWAPWTPCPPGHWCSKFGDRFSVSLISARAPHIFNEYNGGLIINSTTAHRHQLCSWATDARSFRAARTCLPSGTRFQWGNPTQMFERREDCIPGCLNGVENQREDWDTVMHGQLSPSWCEPGGDDAWCPWRPENLKNMLQQQERGFRSTDCAQNNGCQYNEMVLNSSGWVDELPHTVEAIFRLKGSDPHGISVNDSHTTHMAFLESYGLTDAHIPLLELDLKAQSPNMPFREVRNQLLIGTRYAASNLWAD